MATELSELRIVPNGRAQPEAAAASPMADQSSSATPAEINLGTLNSPVAGLRVPLPLEVRRDEKRILVWSHDLQRMGAGAHLTAAIMDLQRAIVAEVIAGGDIPNSHQFIERLR